MPHVRNSPSPDDADPKPDLDSVAAPLRTSSADALDDPPRVGVLAQPAGEAPNVPRPMVQEGAPD